MSDILDRAKDSLNVTKHSAAMGVMPQYPIELVQKLVDEVERLRSACKTLGETIDGQCRMVLNITGLHHLIDETGDGDWGLIWEKLAELGSGRLFDE